MARLLIWSIGLLLLACSPSPKGDRLAFLVAAENGDTHIVREELEKGVRPDDVFQVNDRTALFLAAMNGHPAVVELLLEKGADVQATHLGASLKMTMQAHWGHVRDATANPESGATYKRVDGTIVPMKSLRLVESDCEKIKKLVDDATAKAAGR